MVLIPGSSRSLIWWLFLSFFFLFVCFPFRLNHVVRCYRAIREFLLMDSRMTSVRIEVWPQELIKLYKKDAGHDWWIFNVKFNPHGLIRINIKNL
jgi:hypothetical protein